jgi:hypothetical protein
MKACIDLREYGDRYRVWNELEDRKAHQADDPWDVVISGWAGFVAPYGGSCLLACTNSDRTARKILQAVPGARVIQEGSDGSNIAFDVTHFETVASILRLRRRRVVSPEQRAIAVQRLAKYHFSRSDHVAG